MKRIGAILTVFATLSVFFPGVVSAWDGNWSRDSNSPERGSQLIISGANEKFFNFKIDARWKNHTGGIEGTAEISSEHVAIFNGKNNCQLTFQAVDGTILVQQTDGCTFYSGMNVVFKGNYIRSE